jgi:hypothetical protein
MTIKAQTRPPKRFTVTMMFSHSRTVEGIDVAAVIRSGWPDATFTPRLTMLAPSSSTAWCWGSPT